MGGGTTSFLILPQTPLKLMIQEDLTAFRNIHAACFHILRRSGLSANRFELAFH